MLKIFYCQIFLVCLVLAGCQSVEQTNALTASPLATMTVPEANLVNSELEKRGTLILSPATTPAAAVVTTPVTESCSCTVVVTATPTPTLEPARANMTFSPLCVSNDEWVKCSDDLLDLTFEYPARWGTINAKLHRGFEAGFGYDYVITSVETGTETLQAMAAGQGVDYRDLGRGGRIGDFNGFQGKSSAQICQDTPLCEVIKPGVVLTVHFVDSHFVCDFNQGVPFYPFGTIMVNLPQHNLINGFMFVSKVLSVEEERKLLSILDVTENRQPRNCSEEARTTFDAAVATLKAQIQSGVNEAGRFDNLQSLRHLAESLAGVEVAE